MQLNLPSNRLYGNQQLIEFEKITALIGENGAGKSSILQSIFVNRLAKSILSDKKVVCFSSGQNEKFSEHFSNYLNQERNANRGLSLDCCYYDKTWSKLLIFLSTISNDRGLVRSFLVRNNYVELSENNLTDISSTLTFSVQVSRAYVNRVQKALQDEEDGEIDTLRSTSYHRTLESFINTIVDHDYDFSSPMESKSIQLDFQKFNNPSYINTAEDYFDPIISFYTQAADNDYFISKPSMKLTFKDDLELSDLSDGEYQILFLYSLLDLFDHPDTIFLLDEIDSHLHYKNIEILWKELHAIKGHAITSTHLIDSITARENTFSTLKIVNRGKICEQDKMKALIQRLSMLTRINSVQFELCNKLDNIVVLDHYNDWKIFTSLAHKKNLDIAKLINLQPVKHPSGYGNITHDFAKSKIDWLENLLSSNSDRKPYRIFLVCDRDEAILKFKDDGVSVAIQQLEKRINEIKNKYSPRTEIYLLSWHRREIKNYLLSYSAMSEYDKIGCVNNDDLPKNSYLKLNDPGDNDHIRALNVKEYMTELIDSEGIGLDEIKLAKYISCIPEEEISIDIENMFKFLESKL
ncbi:AAA family ATPase [Raoultella planticola]|uniref:AAA family ATPase n=1 Tax=Raoultella planticola TaxID=575 RepID=UPI0036D726E0